MFLSKNSRKKTIERAIIITVLIAISAQARGLSVGTAPGVLDLGEVNAGQNVDFMFYLVSNTENDILVDLTPIAPHLSMFLTNQTGRYKFIPEYSSNMPVEDWVEVKRHPVLVSPSKTKLVKLADGGLIRANGEGEVTLHVPEDAEPCYFISSINLSPIVNPKEVGGGAAVSTIGVTRFVLVFKVVGEASRTGEVVDVMPFRDGRDTARFDVLFRNEGKCTVLAWLQNLTLYAENGTRIADITSGNVLVPPGKIGIITTRWTSNYIKEGDYRAEARVQYYTGSSFMEKKITILKPPPTPTGGAQQPGGKCSFPWWILIVLFAALLVFYVLDRMDSVIVRIILLLIVVVTLAGAVLCFSSIPWTWFLLAVILILLHVYLRG